MCRGTAEEDGPSLDPPHGPLHHHGPHGRLGQAPLQETLQGGGGVWFSQFIFLSVWVAPAMLCNVHEN